MAYYKRIRDLREDADKTQSDIAKYLGTTAQYYGKYENGERELPFARAIMLAEYYNVSLDYLAGRYDISIYDNESEFITNWSTLSERNKGKVEYLMSELIKQQSDNK